MLKNMPRGVVTFCPPGQPILRTFVFWLLLIFFMITGLFSEFLRFIIYSARKAGDLARKTAKAKLMRLAQVRAKMILGKCQIVLSEQIFTKKHDFM